MKTKQTNSNSNKVKTVFHRGYRVSCHVNSSRRSKHAARGFPIRFHLVVGALGLNVSSLLALVADLLATSRLLGAVTGVVTRLAAVVALHAVDTLARHVAVTTARVAGLAGTAETTAVATAEASLGAVAGNVAHLSALVALSGLAVATAGRALARKVTGLAALVASSGAVVLGRLRAVTAHVTLAAAVVALSRTLAGAVTGLVTSVSARVAGTTGRSSSGSDGGVGSGGFKLHCEGEKVRLFKKLK